ncbi:dentin sialophosphoprotein-like [Heracleum sosnowskyi]|uniref:Dentin sialophosphoprotein-like n=1 Tax=Heracleum sosnowskyi TaxID=360622 RepID=A0AAD8MLY9_9APIA|nr:dentin sialophosphoprotein-like [Heracleum sosnowskyi]
MLHKSFKPAKCKTSLKLATARIKLMKNKKGVQMNQMKNDLAKLLQSGQDRTARIRVEHFIREEKMVAAYDLIELYCELIAARLPIIESQKNCPIDLKEAIASVIFAAPRCSDVPELLDVKKHFTAKYGKEFVTTALELRPSCGVGRMLVEKLSAVAPDGQAKFKVLNAIAEEHNIKWDSISFEEKETKPVNDLVNGPSTFEKASEMAVEAPEISVSNVQATSSHDRHSKPLNFTEPNTVSSIDAHNVLPVNRGGRNTTATTHSDLRHSGNETKVGSHSFSGDENYSSRQDWKMEFKDARSAAQAAAESAERASMAARAAAEFSRRENDSRPLSSESKNSINNSTRQERPGTYASSELPGEHFGNVPVKNSSSHSGNSKVRNEQIVRGEYQSRVEPDDRFRTYDDANTRKTSHPTSLRSGESTLDDIKSVNNMQKAHEYSEKTSFEETTKQVKEPLYSRMGMKQHYVESKDESSSSWQDDSIAEHFDQYGEARMEKQDQLHSSRSHFSTESETDDITFKESENNAAKDLYVGNDQDDIYRNTTRMNSYDDKSVTFEEYDSSDGSHNLDKPPQYDEGESTSYVPPLGSNSSFSSTSVDIWNPRKDTIKSPEKSTFEAHHFTEDHPSTLFSESTEKMSDLLGADNVPVAPYDFDGPKFDSEDEVEMPINEQNEDVFSLDPESADTENHGSSEPLLVNRKSSGYDRKPSVGSSSDDDMGTVEAHQQINPMIVVNSESPKFDSEYKQNIRQSSNLSLVHTDEDSFHVTESPEILKDEDLQLQSNSEEESKLNFGTLTGGFRNKGHRHLPSIRNLSGDSSSVTLRNTDESSAMSEQKTAAPSLESSVNTTARTDANKKSSFSLSTQHSDSDSQTDDSGDEVQQNITSGRQASHAKKPSKEVKYKSSFRPPVVTYFDLDNDDYNDDVSKPNVPNKIQLGSAISRRTKPSPSGTGPKSYSQIQAEHQESASPTSSKERTPTRSRPDNATPTKLKSEMESTGYLNSDEQPNYAKKVASKASVSEISSDEKPSNSSAVEQSSSAPRRTGASSSPQNPKTSKLTGEPPAREDSKKRASHVHPKLPDYDNIAYHLQYLRTDKQ